MTSAEGPFDGTTYRGLTVPTWAICDATGNVSHDRLDRVAAGKVFLSEHLSVADLERIEVGLRHALGLAR